MNTTLLREIGFTDNEIRVYTELLKCDAARASEIAKKARVNRTHTYQVLNKLLSRGVISYFIKGNIKHFRAADPSSLVTYLKEKQRSVQTLIPDLKKLKLTKKSMYSIEVYEGKEGLKTLWEEITRVLKKGDELLILGGTGKATDTLPYYIQHWERKRVRKGVKMRALFDNSAKARKRVKELQKLPLTKIKMLPKSIKNSVGINIYGNRVDIHLWSRELPFGILIKNKEASDRFKELFDFFWDIC